MFCHYTVRYSHLSQENQKHAKTTKAYNKSVRAYVFYIQRRYKYTRLWLEVMQGVHVKLNPGLLCQKQHKTRRRLFTSKLKLNLRENLVKCYTWSISSCGAETWDTSEIRSEMEGFEMWCWRRMEKISWTDGLRNEEVLHRVKGERNILRTIKWRLTELITSCVGITS
jgi:hypothetical protein